MGSPRMTSSKLRCWLCWLVGCLALAFGLQATAAEPTVEKLWPAGAPGAIGSEEADIPTLTIWRPDPAQANGCAVVICPGGGYGGLAIDHEGKQIAAWMIERGITACILKYRHAPRYRHPAPWQDVGRAIRTVRAQAAEWKLDPQRIGVMGFSAGGHLASTAATQFDPGRADATDPIERVSSRPDFAILCYPVISLVAPFTHAGSRNNLLGPQADPKLAESLSSELRVTERTPPTFLFHTTEDEPVPPENSLAFYAALRRHKVPVEMHVYEKGRHGVGLAQNDPVLSSWPDRLAAWLKSRGLLAAASK